MTPGLRELIAGCATALAVPQPPEAGADYAAARVGLVTMLLALAGYEAERAAAAAAAENAAISRVLGDAAPVYSADQTLPALDAANADLRRRLIDLHAAAEARGDDRLDRAILELYGEMAAGRRLDLAAALAR